MPVKTAHRPTTFDLGEARKSVVLSATEGEDKSIKFPDMFAHGNLMLLNKMDLLPYLNFDLESCIDYARSVNSRIDIMTVQPVSARECRLLHLDRRACRCCMRSLPDDGRHLSGSSAGLPCSKNCLASCSATAYF
jgi:Ni2+-binding GTPase involved in maturation of urease and hydrogenase